MSKYEKGENKKMSRGASPATLFITFAMGLMAIAAGLWSNPTTRERIKNMEFVGWISYYNDRFSHREPSPGEASKTDQEPTLTAAHRSLPIGSKIKIENLKNKKSAIVEITERGPLDDSRVLNVSEETAQKLGFTRDGTTKARITVIDSASEKGKSNE